MMNICIYCHGVAAEGNQTYIIQQPWTYPTVHAAFSYAFGRHALFWCLAAKDGNVFILLATQVSHQVAKQHPIKSGGQLASHLESLLNIQRCRWSNGNSRIASVSSILCQEDPHRSIPRNHHWSRCNVLDAQGSLRMFQGVGWRQRYRQICEFLPQNVHRPSTSQDQVSWFADGLGVPCCHD